MPDIFISHATKDDETITKIHDELERATGREMWVDHVDIKPGMNWQEAIETALYQCPDLLLVISRASMDSVEVMAEWRGALTYHHRLLLAVIDDIPLEKIPSRLRLIQWINLHQDWDAGMQKLIAAIKDGEGDSGVTADDVPDFKHVVTITGEIDRRLTQTPLRGRDSDLDKIRAGLTAAPTLIVGVGGLGKSKLAAETALTGDYAGVIWHRVSEYSQAYEVIDLLKTHFKLPATTDRTETLAKLRNSKRLIVLDNAEDAPPDDSHHPDYVKLVEALLSAGGQVLVTSRVEWKALKPVKMVEPSQLDPANAAQMVRDLADLEKVPGLDPLADEIARDALYHPRLIEWAVGLMTELPRAEVMRDLKAKTSDDAQEAMREMIGKTLERMVKDSNNGGLAAAALERLVICRGGFTFEAAKAIVPNGENLTDSDDIRAALTTLTTWRFVRFDVSKQRYDLPLMVITAVTPNDTAYRPHYDYYLILAEQHRDRQDYAGLDVESDNLEVAFEWALRTGDNAAAYWLVNACRLFQENRGRFEQYKNWLERTVTRIIGVKNVTDTRLLGAAHVSLGVMYWQHSTGDKSDNLKRAVKAFEQALAYSNTSHDYAVIQHNLGTIHYALAEIENQMTNKADRLRQ
ncbi:MAG TPA: toll/interleukin-1 receptor domain-containing protein, partial [Phototrophicaceae bacterium]|nr:toll/interleukin-1 receptor domain-containing protein [Phototrophicaceae bacterium]